MRWQFSIAGCLGVVFVVAFGLAALRSGSVYWLLAVAWVALFWLSAAVVGAIFSEGSARAFWTGFAVFGWACVLLMNNPGFEESLANELTDGLSHFLRVHFRWFRTPEQPERTQAICGFIMNLSFAFIGGLTALGFNARLHAARQRRQQTPPPGNTP
jgi:hypothetical protein